MTIYRILEEAIQRKGMDTVSVIDCHVPLECIPIVGLQTIAKRVAQF